MQGAHRGHMRGERGPQKRRCADATDAARCDDEGCAEGVAQTGCVCACMHVRTCNRATSKSCDCQSRPAPTASNPPSEYRRGSTCARHHVMELPSCADVPRRWRCGGARIGATSGHAYLASSRVITPTNGELFSYSFMLRACFSACASMEGFKMSWIA